MTLAAPCRGAEQNKPFKGPHPRTRVFRSVQTPALSSLLSPFFNGQLLLRESQEPHKVRARRSLSDRLTNPDFINQETGAKKKDLP